MKSWWQIRDLLVLFMGSDVDAVRRIDKLDARQREIGHDIRNIQMQLPHLKNLVENMRGEGPKDVG